MERKTVWGGAGEGTFLENGGQREQWREHWTQGPNWPLDLREPLRALPRTSVCADKCADMHSAHMDTWTHAQTHTDSPMYTQTYTTHTNASTTHTDMWLTHRHLPCAHRHHFPPSPQSRLFLISDSSRVATALTCVTYFHFFLLEDRVSPSQKGEPWASLCLAHDKQCTHLWTGPALVGPGLGYGLAKSGTSPRRRGGVKAATQRGRPGVGAGGTIVVSPFPGSRSPGW